MDSIWAFLQDEANRTVLAWIGGGVVVVVGGLWAAFKFFVSKQKPKPASSQPCQWPLAVWGRAGTSVTVRSTPGADRSAREAESVNWLLRTLFGWIRTDAVNVHRGGVGAGRDIRDSTIQIQHGLDVKETGQEIAQRIDPLREEVAALRVEFARERGVDPKVLIPLFEHLGQSGLTLDEMRSRASEAIEAILSRARQKVEPSNDGSDVDATIGAARARLGSLDTAGARAIVAAKIAEEKTQRLVPLLEEQLRSNDSPMTMRQPRPRYDNCSFLTPSVYGVGSNLAISVSRLPRLTKRLMPSVTASR
jgi:hypothetical protein